MKGGWCLPPNIESRVWVKFETQATTKELVLATDIIYSRDFPGLTHTYLAIELPAVPETVRIPQLKQMPLERWKVDEPLAGEDEMGQPSTPIYSISFLCEIFGFSVARFDSWRVSLTHLSIEGKVPMEIQPAGSPQFPEVPEFSAGSIHPQSPRRQRNMGDANWEAAQPRLGWESPGTMFPGWSEQAYPTQNWLRFHGRWPVALMLNHHGEPHRSTSFPPVPGVSVLHLSGWFRGEPHWLRTETPHPAYLSLPKHGTYTQTKWRIKLSVVGIS